MKNQTFWIFLSLIGLGVLSSSCHRKCETPATVAKLECGYGYVFELTNGDHLLPIADVKGSICPVLPTEIPGDPLYNFQFIEGDKVLIGYDKRGSKGACGNVTYAVVTCLQQVELE